MLQQPDIPLESNNNETFKEDILLGITSLEEADCYVEFLSKPYPSKF